MAKALPKKKEPSSTRVTSSQGQAPNNEASSLLASASEGPGEERRCRYPIWPEWNEADVNAEKWDVARPAKDGKIGKSPCAPFFEDPEGKVQLPPPLKVHSWKRPSECFLTKAPLIVENESSFDLIAANEHLLCIELFRWIMSEIYIVWKVCNGTSPEQGSEVWKPWEHIYSMCKVVKGHMPLYNINGKYVVKLYWMGCWRKITVDDALPFDEDNSLLLPATTNQSELWPMLLAKAIIKVANSDVVSGHKKELGEFTVIHTLTGWIPEIIPVQFCSLDNVWDFLKDTIPKFEYVEEKTTVDSSEMKESILNEGQSESPPATRTLENRKDSAKKKGKEMEKDRISTELNNFQPNSINQPTTDSSCSSLAPAKVVCASYQPLNLLEKISEKVDSGERLRQYGLTRMYSHQVLLTRVRDCPLVAPPKPPPVPRWKLIRPRKETIITDEPREPAVVKPEQFIEVSSPLINYRQTIPAAQELECHKSSRRNDACSSTQASFMETEESEIGEAPEPGNAQQSINSLDGVDIARVTAEDKTKDDNTTNDPQMWETVPSPSSGQPKLDKEPSLALLNPVDTFVPEKPLLQESWVDLEDFITCFQTLLVFHKPNSYVNHFQTCHFKSTIMSKGSAVDLNCHVGSTHSTAVPLRHPDSISVAQIQSPEEEGSHYLLVDSLQASYILISFSALVHWGDTEDELESSTYRSGVLVAKPYSWKSLQISPICLRIQTTACKAALLTLPPGRHVLCVHMRAPLGYHVHLCSMGSFVFGDEETVLPHLAKESLRFCEQALMVLKALGGLVNSFTDELELPAATKALEDAHLPPQLSTVKGLQEHQRVFSEAVDHMFCVALDRTLSAEEVFAVQALTSLCTNKTKGPSPTGTKENLSAFTTLQEMWSCVESDAEKHAVALLRYIFSKNEKTAELYPCHKDEWTKTTFTEFSVPLPESVNSWILVFREVFLVPKEMLLVPKVYSSIPLCLLHVIDNDTLEELPMIFQRVEPHIYKPNQNGYTFVAEAHTLDTPFVGAKWKMRLIGSCDPLASLARESPLNNFFVKDFRDYYIPSCTNIICRYSVTVTADHVGTVQFQTSNMGVHIHLSILDHEKEVASNTGKGHVIIPVFWFHPDNATSGISPKPDEKQNQEETTVTGSTQGGEVQEGMVIVTDQTQTQPPMEERGHKYIVQAEVLHNSWTLDDSQMAFAHTLRELEWKVHSENQEDQATATSTDSQNSEGQKTSLPKGNRKGKVDKDKTPAKLGSRTEMILDESKPSWTLRVVSDHCDAEAIDVKKDTERLDEIRALKMAWETAEPGRYVKALRSRLQYLSSRKPATHSQFPDASVSPSNQDVALLNQPESAHSHLAIDYSSFIRKQRKVPVLNNQIQSFRLVRDMVLEHRRQQEAHSKDLNRRQLETYNGMQVALREQLQKVLVAREAFQNRLREEERRRQEEDTALEVARQAELEKNAVQQPTKLVKIAGKKQ
ncbi:hypothetical protein UPYG_G00256710 [Umbra pygmaea]|uniref:Androglobin n=1 Tax=Umbra pygmaea TaxID=75934 RepID=A0ABD0W8K2_UMBPY